MFNGVKTLALMAAMMTPLLIAGAFLDGWPGLALALLPAVAINALCYWFCDAFVLWIYHAQEVDEGSAPQLHALVSELALRARLPMPRLFLIDELAPNAFSTGRNPRRAAIVATTGMLRILSERELRGVVSHELAHVRHRDSLISTVAAGMGIVISNLANLKDLLVRRHEPRHPANIVSAHLAILLVSISEGLIRISISRQREYLADLCGAEISGDPEALASALEKIHRNGQTLCLAVAEAHPETAQMMIINPLSNCDRAGRFATHPPTEERITRLMSTYRDAAWALHER